MLNLLRKKLTVYAYFVKQHVLYLRSAVEPVDNARRSKHPTNKPKEVIF